MDKNSQAAARIKSIREEKNIAAKYIADALSLSVGAYSRIESGQTQLTVENLYKISDALETPIVELLQLENKIFFTNNNSTVLQQGSNHSLNISLSPKEFEKLSAVFKKGQKPA